jgi:hypothetical protein
MTRTAVLLIAIAVLGLLDHDGRLARGDVAARVFGYTVRVELRVERNPVPAVTAPTLLADRCGIAADTLTREVVWP